MWKEELDELLKAYEEWYEDKYDEANIIISDFNSNKSKKAKKGKKNKPISKKSNANLVV